MIALVEFDRVIKKEIYESLKDVYDFGKTTDRIANKYGELIPLDEDDYFKDELVKVDDEDGGWHYVLKTDMNKTIASYHVEDRAEGDYIAIKKTQHVADLKELYKTCRKAQVKILEVARIE